MDRAAVAAEPAPSSPFRRVREIADELRRRSPSLFWLGSAHLLLGVILVAMMPFDHGTVLGIDRWVKPFKFAVSIWIYLWTFAWLLDLVRSRILARTLAGVTAVCMVLEIVLITMQSARGTISHFNVATAFDGSVFSLMGIAIGVSTLTAATLLVAIVLAPPRDRPRTYLLGVKLGLAVFLVGSSFGGAMVMNGGHAVGVDDGGPGLPLVNWSTEAGDLRVAHGLGLHALQILPFFAWWISLRQASSGGPSPALARATVWTVSAAYLGLTVLLYLQARAGAPLLG